MKKEALASLFIVAALAPTAEARNPFEFGVEEETEKVDTSHPRLTLILAQGERRTALIDGVSCDEGEETRYGVVTRIDTEGVLLTRNDGSSLYLAITGDR